MTTLSRTNPVVPATPHFTHHTKYNNQLVAPQKLWPSSNTNMSFCFRILSMVSNRNLYPSSSLSIVLSSRRTIPSTSTPLNVRSLLPFLSTSVPFYLCSLLPLFPSTSVPFYVRCLLRPLPSTSFSLYVTLSTPFSSLTLHTGHHAPYLPFIVALLQTRPVIVTIIATDISFVPRLEAAISRYHLSSALRSLIR